MNFDYHTFYHIPNYKPAFCYILQSQPEVKEAHDRVQSLIDNSIFKGKISSDLCIYKGVAQFTTFINNTHSCNNFVNAYSGLWVKLGREIDGIVVRLA